MGCIPPNEKFNIGQFEKGIKTVAHFFELYGDAR